MKQLTRTQLVDIARSKEGGAWSAVDPHFIDKLVAFGREVLRRTEPVPRVPTMDVGQVIHLLRNPWGWAESDLRRARLEAAALIEASENPYDQRTQPEQPGIAKETMNECATSTERNPGDDGQSSVLKQATVQR